MMYDGYATQLLGQLLVRLQMPGGLSPLWPDDP